MTHANKEVSTALYQAFTSKKPIDFISSSFELNELEAYHTQDDLINQLKNKQKSEIKGYKVSMTSAATQAIANTNEPAYGTILSTQVVEGDNSISLSTLFASLIEPIVFKRKPDWVEVIIGIIIVICISLIFNAELKYKEGIFYGILCALFGTIFSVFNGKIFGKTSSGNIIFYEIAGGWLVISLFFIFTGQISSLSEISYTDIALIVLLASVFTAYPMFESVKLMKFISPFTLILTVNLEPVYGIILAFFIFGASEHMSPVFYIASFIMIMAIVANGIIKSRRKKDELPAEITPQ